ncbi:MAG: nucleotide sugar dehydrogenase [Candidatus Schekmanbacteria bacterium]|nr:MAG: nucleotide sugar dehydrogenase [Candidatus Schekmanbacteria bacterium]
MNIDKLIKTKKAKVAVIGLGYVGLPLAMEIVNGGFSVVGIDVEKKKVNRINRGSSPVLDVSDDILKNALNSKRFSSTTDYSILKKADIITICVPTPLRKTRDPDISYIIAAINNVKNFIRKGQLIILESTTYPGTTRELIKPTLESSGLKAGKDFFLAFSPERIDPGNKEFTTKNTPKVVGGISPKCTKIAALFYSQFIDSVTEVSNSDSAEMVKLLENTFRSVNIGLVNEMALICDKLGINVWEVIDAAATKPFGFMPFYPGPGLGGHCIPIDPHYLSWKLKELNFNARFIELAGEVNSHMPEFVISKITDSLNIRNKSVKGAKVLIIGVSYKRDINDMRESPALDIIGILDEKGAKISYYDPYIPSFTLKGKKYKSKNLTPNEIKNADCVVITTNHSCIDYEKVVKHSKLIVDTRNALKNFKRNRKKIVLL